MNVPPGGKLRFPSRSLLRPQLLLLASVLFAVPGQAQSITSIAISPSQASVNIGGTQQLSVTATYSDGSTGDVTSGVAWSTSDPRLVTVSSSGLASGIATGSATITASVQGQNASATVSSSMGDVQWSGPLVITKGGTYSGNWKSTDPNTPAVTVATTDPVLIQNSYVTGPSDLISDAYWGNNLTVKNVIGVGTNPNVKGQAYGMFVDAQNPALLDVENSYFENVTYGIYVRGYAGDRDGTQTITITNNRGRNMMGLESDGNNGVLPGDQVFVWSHAIQISNVNAVPGIQIAWNEIINYPYQSLTNENISMFDSGGNASSPAEIHDNYIQGAYAYDPVNGSSNSGGITTDGSGSDTVQTAAAFNNFYNNQVVSTVNMGIELGAGHDNTAYNNTVISSGLLSNGSKIAAQNVGITVYDVYGNIANGSMYNNDMHDNVVGWMCWAARCAWDGYRNDEYFPDNPSYYSTNQSINSNPITYQQEDDQYTTWLAKLAGNNVVVGSTSQVGSPDVTTGTTTISPSAWYTVTNTNSSLCVDAAGWGYANGTVVQQYNCGAGQQNQEWQFQPTDSGYYQVVSRYALTRSNSNVVWDVTGGSWATGDQIPVQLWTYVGGTNQQWMPVALGNGAYKFVARHSSKCLDVPGASSAPQLQLQQYDCNGTGAQSFTLQQQ